MCLFFLLFLLLFKYYAFSSSIASRRKLLYNLSRGDGDFRLRRGQLTLLQFKTSQQRPGARLPHAIQSHRDVDDDFSVGRLRRQLVLHDVRSPGVADPPGGVQKADTRDGKLTQVFQVPVDDQVR